MLPAGKGPERMMAEIYQHTEGKRIVALSFPFIIYTEPLMYREAQNQPPEVRSSHFKQIISKNKAVREFSVQKIVLPTICSGDYFEYEGRPYIVIGNKQYAPVFSQ